MESYRHYFIANKLTDESNEIRNANLSIKRRSFLGGMGVSRTSDGTYKIFLVCMEN